MNEAPEQPLRELGDLLAETGTKQAEWAIGIRAIWQALGKNTSNTDINRLPKDLPIVTVKNMFAGKHLTMLAVYRPNIETWLKKHKPTPLPLPSPEQQQENRLALLEKAVAENTGICKAVYHKLTVLEADIHKLLD